MNLGLQGKVALVTGGSKGIGLYSALQFVKEGAKVAIVARGEEGLAEAKSKIQELTGAEVFTISANVSVEAESRCVSLLVSNIHLARLLFLVTLLRQEWRQIVPTIPPLNCSLYCVKSSILIR